MLRIPAIVFLLVISATRLPAPIVEEEKPTPAPTPQQSGAPKPKRPAKSTTESSSQTAKPPKPAPPPALEGPARFAGTWTGKINQGLLGHVESSITVNSNASRVELSQNLGGGKKHLRTEGNTISWKTGIMGEITWTLTPSDDGQTAEVAMKGLLLKDTATFRRGQAGPAPSTASQKPAAKSTAGNEESSAAGGSMSGPRPKYTQAMRDARLAGTGTYLLHFDTSNGNVTDVTVSQSSGSPVLDQAAIEAFRQWHEQPGGKKEFPLTISFP